eukprot:363941-Chlamydomonas_euryale.AAC.12
MAPKPMNGIMRGTVAATPMLGPSFRATSFSAVITASMSCLNTRPCICRLQPPENCRLPPWTDMVSGNVRVSPCC